jgi:hypothetical protein
MPLIINSDVHISSSTAKSQNSYNRLTFRMDDLLITFFIIVTLIFIDVWILLWFLASHWSMLHPFNRNKLVCLELESIYFLYCVNRLWKAPREDFVGLFIRFCFCSFIGVLLEMVVTFITTGKYGLSFIK